MKAGPAHHSNARVCLAPLVAWEHPPWAALCAVARGVPVVASDRGGAAELLGGAAVTFPLPDRVTAGFTAPFQRAEIAPWVEAVLRLFDDPAYAARQRAAALVAGQRLAAAELAPQYARFLADLVARRAQPGNGVPAEIPPGRGRSVVGRRRLRPTGKFPSPTPARPNSRYRHWSSRIGPSSSASRSRPRAAEPRR